MSHAPARRVEGEVRRALAGRPAGSLVLAVSGGRDSMALLHAAARVARGAIGVVATFDHRTGPAARAAAAFVANEAAALALPAVIGQAGVVGRSEADWRAQRRAFLGEVARGIGGAVVTAHTRDDQLETVFMRVLRESGARGLAGLYAGSDAVRPLLDCTRADVVGYVAEQGLAFVEDPTNASMRFLRNRVRRDLLPALTLAQPGLDRELLHLARSAATWRSRLDAAVAAIARVSAHGDRVGVAVTDLAPHTRDELAVLWPAIAARVGLAMDWRGTERAAAFTTESRTGARMQLSGGWEIVRARDWFELRRWR